MMQIWQKGLEFFIHGGWIMYPMAAIAITGVAVALERLWTIREAVNRTKKTNDMIPLLKKGEFDTALRQCEQIGGPVAGVLVAGLKHRNMPMGDVERAMEEAAARELPHLNARLGILDTVITMAPLMGLLGTITGMIGAFAVVSGPDAASQSSALVGGVGEALIATATGLGIAITMLPIYNAMTERVKDITSDIETSATEFLNILAVRRAADGYVEPTDTTKHTIVPGIYSNDNGAHATSAVNQPHAT